MSNAETSGFHHVTLNVHDLETSERWYGDVLGLVRLTTFNTDDFQRVIMRHAESGMVLALNRHKHPDASDPFSERRTGLDHLAMGVTDRNALEAWISHFDSLGVTHSEIKSGGVPGSFLVAFRDPDNIQLEMFATGD